MRIYDSMSPPVQLLDVRTMKSLHRQRTWEERDWILIIKIVRNYVQHSRKCNAINRLYNQRRFEATLPMIVTLSMIREKELLKYLYLISYMSKNNDKRINAIFKNILIYKNLYKNINICYIWRKQFICKIFYPQKVNLMVFINSSKS